MRGYNGRRAIVPQGGYPIDLSLIGTYQSDYLSFGRRYTLAEKGNLITGAQHVWDSSPAITVDTLVEADFEEGGPAGGFYKFRTQDPPPGWSPIPYEEIGPITSVSSVFACGLWVRGVYNNEYDQATLDKITGLSTGNCAGVFSSSYGQFGLAKAKLSTDDDHWEENMYPMGYDDINVTTVVDPDDLLSLDGFNRVILAQGTSTSTTYSRAYVNGVFIGNPGNRFRAYGAFDIGSMRQASGPTYNGGSSFDIISFEYWTNASDILNDFEAMAAFALADYNRFIT